MTIHPAILELAADLEVHADNIRAHVSANPNVLIPVLPQFFQAFKSDEMVAVRDLAIVGLCACIAIAKVGQMCEQDPHLDEMGSRVAQMLRGKV